MGSAWALRRAVGRPQGCFRLACCTVVQLCEVNGLGGPCGAWRPQTVWIASTAVTRGCSLVVLREEGQGARVWGERDFPYGLSL